MKIHSIGARSSVKIAPGSGVARKFASVLRSMGVQKGDRVTIYMGRVPELIIAMLACAKIGAVHSVVYGGFSEQALADRLGDAQSRVLVTQDGSWVRGKIVELKRIADEAVKKTPIVEHVIVYKRTGHDVPMEPDRDFWWHDLMALPIAANRCETEVMDAEDPLFILYTSGSTGRPKGIVWNNRGVLHAVMRHTNMYRVCERDRFVMFRASLRSFLYALLNGSTYFPIDLHREGPDRHREGLDRRPGGAVADPSAVGDRGCRRRWDSDCIAEPSRRTGPPSGSADRRMPAG